MTDSRRPKMSDEELLYRILKVIETRDGVIESDLYDIVGTARRLRPILDRLCDRGFVITTMRDRGQRVPVYHLTDYGRLLFHVDGLRHEILGMRSDDKVGEMLLETGEVNRIRGEYENVRRLMRVVFEDDGGSDDSE